MASLRSLKNFFLHENAHHFCYFLHYFATFYYYFTHALFLLLYKLHENSNYCLLKLELASTFTLYLIEFESYVVLYWFFFECEFLYLFSFTRFYWNVNAFHWELELHIHLPIWNIKLKWLVNINCKKWYLLLKLCKLKRKIGLESHKL